MKTLIIFIFVVFYQFSFAQSSLFNDNVRVTKQGKSIFLEGKDCRVLDKEGEALEKWTKSVKEKTQNKSCTCSAGVCRKEVTAVIPDFVEAYQFKHVPTDGPNCWNATLVAAKIIPQLRYTSDFEMNFWMYSPLCRERKSGEALQPGDIIAIRGRDHKEVHGFVHLSDNLSFSKNGFDKSMPYSLQDPNVVFDIYDVSKDCRRKTGMAKGCGNYANYYTCMSMDEYLKKNPIKDSLTKQSLAQLNEVECGISEAVLSGKSSKQLKNLMTSSIKIIKELAHDTILYERYHPNDKVLWQAIYHKCRSLEDQLSLM